MGEDYHLGGDICMTSNNDDYEVVLSVTLGNDNQSVLRLVYD